MRASRNHGGTSTMTLSGIRLRTATALLVCLLAPVALAQDPDDIGAAADQGGQPPALARQVRSLAEAMTAPAGRPIRFVAADTGQPRRPTAKEIDALVAAARALPWVNGKPQSPVFELPNGLRMAPLPPEYHAHHGAHPEPATAPDSPLQAAP